MKTQLTDNEIKELIKAQIECKQAEDRFKALKEQYCRDLVPGHYDSKFGRIIKTLRQQPTTDWNRLLYDNPEINKADYTTTKEVMSICIQNYMMKTGLFD